MNLSIIIPTLNEADTIVATLQALQPLRPQHQLILVDGGSTDNTPALAHNLVDICIQSERGRARQMNAGAGQASNDTLLFLHADTVLPASAGTTIEKTMQYKQWGRFDIAISGAHWMLPVIAFFINLRSRLTGIATGDQAIFVDAALFGRIGGFPQLPLMEDLELCRRLCRIQRPACLDSKVTTSGRRWLQYGVFKTIVRMWILRLAYFIGIAPSLLARHYHTH